MTRWLVHLQTRPRLALAMLVGAAVGLASPLVWPTPPGLVTRALVGWNAGVWLYLLLMGWTMWRADHAHLRRVAVAQAEGAATVLACAVLAAVASLVGIVAELAAAKQPGTGHALWHVLFALATVAGSWLLMPTLFALTYASLYHGHGQGSGLRFPDEAPGFEPDHLDFLYVAMTIAVAAQTSDVSVCSRPLRRLVLLQSLLAFVFNTAILAFTINIAASMF